MNDQNNKQEVEVPAVEKSLSIPGCTIYEIVIDGHLDKHWAAWLGDLKITHDRDGNSRLAGLIPDQAALHGVLAQIRDLGLPLISINRIEPEQNGSLREH